MQKLSSPYFLFHYLGIDRVRVGPLRPLIVVGSPARNRMILFIYFLSVCPKICKNVRARITENMQNLPSPYYGKYAKSSEPVLRKICKIFRARITETLKIFRARITENVQNLPSPYYVIFLPSPYYDIIANTSEPVLCNTSSEPVLRYYWKYFRARIVKEFGNC
jgi:hypothetical protein